MDKAARNGIRIADLMDAEEFESKLRRIVAEKNQVIEQVYGGEPLDAMRFLSDYLGYAEILRPYVTDTSVVLNDAIDDGQEEYCSKVLKASCSISTKALIRMLLPRTRQQAAFVSVQASARRRFNRSSALLKRTRLV